ncbi:MAG: CotH kinase family protein [Verrucomicrobiales bacterium]|nr:CotH kinase family protein [Verrucomicrobiales bacterium]
MFLCKFLGWSSVWLVAIFAFCGRAAEKQWAQGIDGGGKKIVSADDIFAKDGFLRIKIEVPKEGVSKLRRHSWGWGESQKERPSVEATIYEGEKVYTNVALHLKGAAGSFRPVDDRPGFTLNFDKFVKGQNFHGLDKISLNNSLQDPSFLSEKICREMFIAAGVPAPRATHARLEFNGRDLGVYVLAEGWGKKFLKRYFKNTKGNLYDGGFVKEITDKLDVNSGDNPKDHSDLARLAEAAMEPDQTMRMQRLEKVLDVDRFITMVALEVMMGHWDGYSMNKNNYRLFHDADRDKMIFMPHGLDQMFGVMRPLPDSLMPHMEGLVARAVMQASDGRRRYLRTMSQLMTNVFNVEAITNRVRAVAAQLRPAFAERSQSSAHQFDGAARELCSRIVQRGLRLQQQLSLPSDTLSFGSSGMARLRNWKSKTDYGNPVFAERKGSDGRTDLHISLSSGSGVGSWCTRVLLESGRYRFEGRVKTLMVTPDPGDVRGGAGLRIQGKPKFTQKLVGTAEWTDLAFEFEIPEGFRETELRCELRAGKGEAWFETDSLRLVRK